MPRTVRTGHRPRMARVPWAVAAAAVAGVLLAGCDSGPPPERDGEVYPQVEVRYDRAEHKALAEEPGSRPVSVVPREYRPDGSHITINRSKGARFGESCLRASTRHERAPVRAFAA